MERITLLGLGKKTYRFMKINLSKYYLKTRKIILQMKVKFGFRHYLAMNIF